MSHELRTPLNAVIGFSEVLLDRMFGELNERQEEYLRDIWNSGRHLLELLNEILDLSKVEAGQMVLEPSTFSVSSALGLQPGDAPRAGDAARHHRRRRGRRRRRARSRPTSCEFKQVRPQPALQRRQVHPDGGSVYVRAYRRGAPSSSVTVTDTGIGVPAEDQERIFESFQQGRRGALEEEGTGPGLTLVRRIVGLFGGRMWLRARPGEGSTFGFSDPGVLQREEDADVAESLPVIRSRRRRSGIAGSHLGLPGWFTDTGAARQGRRRGSRAGHARRTARRRGAGHRAATTRRLAGADRAQGRSRHRRHPGGHRLGRRRSGPRPGSGCRRVSAQARSAARSWSMRCSRWVRCDARAASSSSRTIR